MAAALGAPVEPRLLRLDHAAADGYQRGFAPDFGVSRERHLAYATTWFAIAATLLALWIRATLRTKEEARWPRSTRARGAALAVRAGGAGVPRTPLPATLLYAFGDKGHHGDTVTRGVLVDPARPVDGAAGLGLLDAWTLVVIARDGCAAGCERTLVTLRQVRLTFGREVDRVARVLVSGAAPDATRFAAAHPDLRVLDAAQAGVLLSTV